MSDREYTYFVEVCRCRGGLNFPGIHSFIYGTSPKKALDRAFPAYEFVKNPSLKFPIEDRITIRGPLDSSKAARRTNWGYIKKPVIQGAVE